MIRRAKASRWYSKGRSALVRIVRESELRQLQMQRTDRVRFGSGILRLRGSHSRCYAALGVHVSLRPHHSPALDHRLEVVVLRGERAVPSSSTPTVAPRQAVRTVERSFPRLSC